MLKTKILKYQRAKIRAHNHNLRMVPVMHPKTKAKETSTNTATWWCQIRMAPLIQTLVAICLRPRSGNCNKSWKITKENKNSKNTKMTRQICRVMIWNKRQNKTRFLSNRNFKTWTTSMTSLLRIRKAKRRRRRWPRRRMKPMPKTSSSKRKHQNRKNKGPRKKQRLKMSYCQNQRKRRSSKIWKTQIWTVMKSTRPKKQNWGKERPKEKRKQRNWREESAMQLPEARSRYSATSRKTYSWTEVSPDRERRPIEIHESRRD